MADDHARRAPTNLFDVLIKLIDKGRIGTFVLVILFALLMYIPFSRMESQDARGVVEGLIDRLLGEQLLTVLLLLALVGMFFGARRKIRILQSEINRLVVFRDSFMHYKRECFEFLQQAMQDGEIRTFDDLKKVRPLDDVEHRSSHFKLE